MTGEVHLTMHARDVMARRGVTYEEVLETIANYNQRWAAKEHKGHPTPNTYIYQGSTLAIVVNEEDPATLRVITVLLRQLSQWTDEDARNRPRTPQNEAT